MSILSGLAIRDAIEHGRIRIDPFHSSALNPVSIDLTLGDDALVYYNDIRRLDARANNQSTHRFNLPRRGPEPHFDLEPGELYLLHTVERVWTDSYVPIIDGKSSIGRLGVQVHMTAGYGDPGFDGQYTLEVTCVRPTRLYPGMRICQMRFETIEGKVELYRGKYCGDAAQGPVPSMSWKQFAPEGSK